MRAPVDTSSPHPPSPPLTETRLLLREFSHRINNDFTSAIGVVSLAAARSPSDEVKAALSAVQDRLQSYASVHRALQMPEHTTQIDAASYLHQLCQAISRSKLECRGIRLVLAVQPLRMDSEACWRLGMIVSELVTNAARHAFGEGGGEIRVELRRSRSSVECRVADDGMTAPAICPARGLKIVEALVDGLDGRIERRSSPRGTMWVLLFRPSR
jgi:two-component sensor histidine kinase